MGVWAVVLASGSLLVAGCEPSGGGAAGTPKTPEQQKTFNQQRGDEMKKAMGATKDMKITPPPAPTK
jgi:hypothetical protein